jgi:hypothetical protein
MTRRPPRMLATLLLVLLSGVVPFTATSPASAGDRTQAVSGDLAEAWYVVTPVAACQAPVGCPPVTAPVQQAFPAGTYHEEVSGGVEHARAYVIPDLSRLPDGAADVTARLVLPIDASAGAGTVAPDSATLAACLVTSPVLDGIYGSTDPPPTVDCKHVAPVAIATQPVLAAVVDLRPLIGLWRSGMPQQGVALLPAESTSPGATWALTFQAHGRAGVPHPSTLLSWTTAGSATDDQPAPAPSPAAVAALVPGFVPTGAPVLPEISAPQPPTPPVPQPAAAPASPLGYAVPAAFRPYHFEYPVVMLLPLALATAGLFLVRTLLRDAAPRRWSPR